MTATNQPSPAPHASHQRSSREAAPALLQCWIDGVAFWTPALSGWPQALAALSGQPLADITPAARPAATLLGANERRRAPDAVLMALEVALAATQDAQLAPGELASVFTSAHGDLPIVDALCSTLAADPLLLSPTRFHHSVHNAASGYWALASGSRAPSTALAGYESSFATGLLEAACQCVADQRPLLLVGGDTGASGALASTNASRGLLAVALVLSPQPGPRSRWALQLQLRAGAAPAAAVTHSAAAAALARNAHADALPLFEALALMTQSLHPPKASPPLERMLQLALGPGAHLLLQLAPHPTPVAA